jgi:hypothetical protein
MSGKATFILLPIYVAYSALVEERRAVAAPTHLSAPVSAHKVAPETEGGGAPNAAALQAVFG